MDREKIARAALTPADLYLGAVVGTLKATHQLDRVTDGFYGLLSKALRAMYTSSNDLEAVGLDNIPAEGGVLFAANHQSWNDVQVLGAACPRRLRFLAKAEFQTWPVLRHLIALTDSPFIKRGGDPEGLAQAIQALRDGKCLAIFPEGTIPGEEELGRHQVQPDTGLLRGKTGAVRLAMAAGVPIVPVSISGTGASFPPEVYPRLETLHLPKPVPVTVRFGEPIHYRPLSDSEPSRDELRRLTKELMLAISGGIDFSRHYVPVDLPMPPLPKVERLGVLLLHGFTSSTRTVSGIVPRLQEAGIPYEMPVLRGHGTVYTDLEGVTARDWYDDAEAALLRLAQEVDQVVVVGLSMGGLVAIDLGIRHPEIVAGVCTLAAALIFKDPLAPVTPVLAKVVHDWPSPQSFHDPECEKANENYPRFMTNAFVSLRNYARETELRLPQLQVPICVLHSKADQIISPVAANTIYREVGSAHRELHWFHRSGHELGQDMEADAVFDQVMDFIDHFVPSTSTD